MPGRCVTADQNLQAMPGRCVTADQNLQATPASSAENFE